MSKLHFNPPQLRSIHMAAPNEIAIFGRGTGKTEGIGAVKTSMNYLSSMPRSSGVILGTTFTQLLTRTLPGLIYGWEKLGFKRDVHYTLCKKPTDKWIKQWQWKGPYRPPLSYQYFIAWYNGAGANLVSQDRQGSSNGITIDWIYGDEAKLLNEEKFKTELIPANRGLIPAFEHNPYHHGITLTTDMPVGTAGKWILDYRNQMDKTTVNRIWELLVASFQLKQLISISRKDHKSALKQQLQLVDQEINNLRRDLLYFHTASTIDNIHALGMSYIKQQLRDTTQFQFDTQILNIEPLKLEDGFYPDFDEEKHGYFSENVDYLSGFLEDYNTQNVFDCRKDNDLHPNAALHISIDYNRRIHPMVVGQVYNNEIRVVNAIHVLYPDKLSELLYTFINYYKPHKKKIVYYWFDHTAVGDQHASRIFEDVVKILNKNGWQVIQMYYGKAPNHEVKYRLYGNLFKHEFSKYKKKIRFNRENCAQLIVSMYKTQTVRTKDGFGKDKSTERDEKFLAEEAPHYSDALDMLVFGLLDSKLEYSCINTNR